MLMLFYLLLILTLGRCKHDQIFETKSVGVGDEVTLTCSRLTSKYEKTTLFWTRLVSGIFPEFLGGTFSFDYKGVNKTPHITTKQGPGTFILHINEAEPSDTGVYYCLEVDSLNMTLVKGTFLRIEGTEPDVTAVIQDSHSDPVRPGDSVSLQCSVLSDSANKTCPGGHSVFWFRTRSDEFPSFLYFHGNSSDGCESSSEAHSAQKCVYSFSKSVSSSDAGTYYCAVATCGEILFGNGTKLDIEETSMWSQNANEVILLLCAVQALSLIVISFLIYALKKKDCFNAAAAVQTHRRVQQRDEDAQFYSAVVFTVMKTGCGAMRDKKAAERQKIYAAVSF